MRYTYTESVIHKNVNQNLQRQAVTYMVLAVVSLALALSINPIFILGVLCFSISCYRAYQNADVEYEYVHTNDVFDIDKVIRNTGRRQILSIKLDQVVIVIPAEYAAADRFSHIKEEDFSDGISADWLYFMICMVNGKQRKLKLQLDRDMLQSLRQWIPEKIQIT